MTQKQSTKYMVWITALLLMLILIYQSGVAESHNVLPEKPMKTKVKTFSDLCAAIFHAENSKKYPYGIRSITIKGETYAEKERYAREICIRTVKRTLNTRADFRCGGVKNSLECLRDRYCPVGSSNDKKGLNKNWLRLIRYFLANPKAVNHG